ncbi:MAG: FAD/NAD(P)-binding protein, partial [Anaerococcus sp.]
MKIAIIGFGLSGFSFLKTLIDNTKYSENFEIDIYEKRDEYPVGIPYEDDSSDKLLNVDADEMVYPESDKDDFKNWMDKKGKSLDDREKMAPRIYFGQYLKDKSKPYINR